MNLNHVLNIARKDFSGISQEKTILFAILLQLFIALFSSFLMVGLTAMYNPDSLDDYGRVYYRVGYCGEDSPVLDKLDADNTIIPFSMDLSTAVALLKERKLAAVLYVPKGYPDEQEPFSVTMYTLKNDIQAALIEMKLKDILLEEEKELRQTRISRLSDIPVSVTFPPGASKTGFYEFIYGVLIPLLLFMPAFISAALIIDLITEEYEQQTLDTIRSTPVTMRELIAGKLLVTLLLVPAQAGIWLILLLLNGVFISHIIEILILVTAGSAVLILMGAIIAIHYPDRTKAQFIFSMVAVIIMLGIVSVPYNPLHIVAQLASGTILLFHGIVILVILCAIILLTVLVIRMADARETAS